MSCCRRNNLNAAQIGSTYSRYNPNPCCMIDARASILPNFNKKVSGFYTQLSPAAQKRALYEVRRG